MAICATCWGRGNAYSSLPFHLCSGPRLTFPWLKSQAVTRDQPIFRTQPCRRAGRRCRLGCMVPASFPQRLWSTSHIAGAGLCASGTGSFPMPAASAPCSGHVVEWHSFGGSLAWTSRHLDFNPGFISHHHLHLNKPSKE